MQNLNQRFYLSYSLFYNAYVVRDRMFLNEEGSHEIIAGTDYLESFIPSTIARELNKGIGFQKYGLEHTHPTLSLA